MKICLLFLAWSLSVTTSVAAQNDGTIDFDVRSTGTRRAVVIGVSKYKNLTEQLLYAHEDARSVADFLRSSTGAEQVVLIIDSSATRDRVLLELQKVAASSKANDTVVIYFAGHGDIELSTPLRDGYLLLHDAPANKAYISNGGISVHELNRWFIEPMLANGVRVILITDACRSGAFITQNQVGADKTTATLLSIAQNGVRLISSGPYENSYEGREWGDGHGMFTFYLLEGLRGAARVDTTSQTVILKDLRAFLERKLQDSRRKQTPWINGDPNAILNRIPPFDSFESDLDSNEPQEFAAGQADDAVPAAAEYEIAVVDHSPEQPTDSVASRLFREFTDALKEARASTPRATAPVDPWDVYTVARKATFPAALFSAMADSLNLFYKSLGSRVFAEYQSGAVLRHDPNSVRKAALGLARLPLVAPSDPDSVNWFARATFLFGYAQYLSSNFRPAITLLDSATRIDPRIAAFHELLGRAFFAIGDTAEARHSLERAASRSALWSRPSQLLSQLADVEGQRSRSNPIHGAYVSAAFDSTQVRRDGIAALLSPYNAKMPATTSISKTFRDSASVAFRSSDLYSAERLFVRAANADTNSAIALGELGALYAAESRWPLAISAYRKALGLSTPTSQLYVRLGDASLQSILAIDTSTVRNYKLWAADSAQTAFNKALAISPQFPAALLGSGLVHSYSGDDGQARLLWQRAVIAATSQGDRATVASSAEALARSWLKANQFDSAIVYWRKALENVGPSEASLRPRLHYDIGSALKHLGRLQESKSSFEASRAGFRFESDFLGEADAVFGLAAITFRLATSRPEIDRALSRFDSAAILRARGLRDSRSSNLIAPLRNPLALEEWLLATASPRIADLDSEASVHSLALAEALRSNQQDILLQDPVGTKKRIAEALGKLARAEPAWRISYYLTADTLLRWVLRPNGKIDASQVAIRREMLAEKFQVFATQKRLGELSSVLQNDLFRLLIPEFLPRAMRNGDQLNVVTSVGIDGTIFAMFPFDSSGTAFGQFLRIRLQPALIEIAGAGPDVIDSLVAPKLFGRPLLISSNSRETTLSQELPALLAGRAVLNESNKLDSVSVAVFRKELGRSDFIYFSGGLTTDGSSTLLFAPGPGDTTLSAGQVLAAPWRSDSLYIVLNVPHAARSDFPTALLSRRTIAVLAPTDDGDERAVLSEIHQVLSHWFMDPDRPALDEALRRTRYAAGSGSRSRISLFVRPPMIGPARIGR